MTIFAITLLTLVILVCTIGMFCEWYKDTVLQSFGMFFLTFGSGGWLYEVYKFQHVSYREMFLITGLALFSVGTLIKQYSIYKREKYGFT